MYTEPEIKSTSGRSYIEYYFDGVRQREYNANRLNLAIFPNKAKTETDKTKLLIKLKFELQKALEKGWNPLEGEHAKPKELSLEANIKAALNSKLNGKYSKTYKRDLRIVSDKLLSFLSDSEKKQPGKKCDSSRFMEFLNTFNTSNRNYMNKRQTLNVLLPGILQQTPKKKCTERLHETFDNAQMKKVLKFLKSKYPRLHLLALLAYGCFLRPHEESRQLQKKHIKEHKIYLSGDENKGQRVRVVHIPDYVYSELLPFLGNCEDLGSYVFTGSNWLLNEDYFKTQWSRAKKKLIELNLINENQTLYSFRHTAAVNVYRKTKDLHLLQQLLGHSDMIVTLKYLRGLGEANIDRLKEAAPDLD